MGGYAYLSSADIVDVKDQEIVGQMKDEYGRPMHSEKFLELGLRETPGKKWDCGEVKLARTVSQFGKVSRAPCRRGSPQRISRLRARSKHRAPVE